MTAHCGFWVFEGHLVGRLATRPAGFSLAKGPVRFPPVQLRPGNLVAEMVTARLSEIGRRRAGGPRNAPLDRPVRG